MPNQMMSFVKKLIIFKKMPIHLEQPCPTEIGY